MAGNSLEITTRVGCRVGCSFCPQKTLVNNYPKDARRELSIEDFERALSTVPRHVEIHFSGYAESLLNPLAPEMMLVAARKGHEIHFYTTLSGLTAEMVDTLIQAAPRVVRVHVPDEIGGMSVSDEEWIALHEIFRRCGFTYATYMAMGSPTKPVSLYLGGLGIWVELPQMLSRGGLVAKTPSRKLSGPIRCGADRWHNNVLLPNGDVQACCMAYDLSLPVGNLLAQDYSGIYTKAEEYRLNQEPPADSICRSCEWACPA